jgi:predicted DNA-binding protein YlxM (UPF0122 family)
MGPIFKKWQEKTSFAVVLFNHYKNQLTKRQTKNSNLYLARFKGI